MNVKPDGQKEARQIRGTESSREHLSNTNFHQLIGSQSFSDGAESVRADRDDGTPRTRIISRGERVTGEMLRQLISEYRNQLAIKTQEIESLANRVQELELLQQELEIKDSE